MWLGKSNTTDVFAEWYSSLTELKQDELIAIVELLAEHGPELDRPTQIG